MAYDPYNNPYDPTREPPGMVPFNGRNTADGDFKTGDGSAPFVANPYKVKYIEEGGLPRFVYQKGIDGNGKPIYAAPPDYVVQAGIRSKDPYSDFTPAGLKFRTELAEKQRNKGPKQAGLQQLAEREAADYRQRYGQSNETHRLNIQTGVLGNTIATSADNRADRTADSNINIADRQQTLNETTGDRNFVLAIRDRDLQQRRLELENGLQTGQLEINRYTAQSDALYKEGLLLNAQRSLEAQRHADDVDATLTHNALMLKERASTLRGLDNLIAAAQTAIAA